MECYNRPPLSEQDGISIFSQQDAYVENYVKISSDHVAAITKDSDNPWIEADVWEEMEVSTLQHVIDSLHGSSNTVRILDVGVGLGRLLERIRSSEYLNLDLYGVDISLPYLRIAHSKGLNVAMAKIEDMPYVAEYFDIIICTDVLEHVVDLNLCISKILTCLKPNGKLIVRVPNREDLSSYLKPDFPYYLAHVRGFDEYSLELMFTRLFNMTFIGKSPALIIQNAHLLKYKLPVKGYNYLVRVVLRAIKILNKGLYRRIVAMLYHPTEINVVLKKKA
jgi:SAM-dependent methyltransferase